jgi:hypothetical protein
MISCAIASDVRWKGARRAVLGDKENYFSPSSIPFHTPPTTTTSRPIRGLNAMYTPRKQLRVSHMVHLWRLNKQSKPRTFYSSRTSSPNGLVCFTDFILANWWRRICGAARHRSGCSGLSPLTLFLPEVDVCLQELIPSFCRGNFMRGVKSQGRMSTLTAISSGFNASPPTMLLA